MASDGKDSHRAELTGAWHAELLPLIIFDISIHSTSEYITQYAWLAH